MNKKTKLFRGKYAIAIYDTDDYLSDIFDNLNEVKKKYNQSVFQKVKDSIRKHCFFYLNKKRFEVHLICLVDDEEDEDE